MKTKSKLEIKNAPSQSTPRFTPQQAEKRLVAVLTPALQAKAGRVFTFV